MSSTRRQWVFGTLSPALAAGIAAAQQHAHQSVGSGKTQFAFLDAAMAADLDALTAQILPSTGGPGAREAGVIYFIDRALTTFDKDLQPAYRTGLGQFRQALHTLFPEAKRIPALSDAQQIELIRSQEKTEFFETLRTHTLLGFLGDPSYGGNSNRVGWKHIGFEGAMSYTPPFGYYDAEAK